MKQAVNSRKRVALPALILLALLVLLLSHRYLEKQLYPRYYTDYVQRYASQYDVPVNLIYAVIRTESNFRQDAVSAAGAAGLMQLMPQTFEWIRDYRLHENLELGMRFDAETNIRYGTYYLRYLYDRYGSWLEACAAYNAGHGTVDHWLEDDTLIDDNGHLTAETIPYTETRNYVNLIEKSYRTYERLYATETTAPFR